MTGPKGTLVDRIANFCEVQANVFDKKAGGGMNGSQQSGMSGIMHSAVMMNQMGMMQGGMMQGGMMPGGMMPGGMMPGGMNPMGMMQGGMMPGGMMPGSMMPGFGMHPAMMGGMHPAMMGGMHPQMAMIGGMHSQMAMMGGMNPHNPMMRGMPNQHSAGTVNDTPKCPVKKEKLEDPWGGEAPPDKEEASKVQSLREMGFNVIESLRCLRRANGDVDGAMVSIISEREAKELEEQSDAARLASEMNKEVDEERRKRRREDDVETALQSGDIAKCGLFETSVLLKGGCGPGFVKCLTPKVAKHSGSGQCIAVEIEEITEEEEKEIEAEALRDEISSDLKRAVVKLLLLEKKSIAWYKNYASDFMLALSKRLESTMLDEETHGRERVSLIDTETNKLERGLMMMPRKPGGIPEIFVQARKKRMEEEPADEMNDEECTVTEVIENANEVCKSVPATIISLGSSDEEDDGDDADEESNHMKEEDGGLDKAKRKVDGEPAPTSVINLGDTTTDDDEMYDNTG